MQLTDFSVAFHSINFSLDTYGRVVPQTHSPVEKSVPIGGADLRDLLLIP